MHSINQICAICYIGVRISIRETLIKAFPVPDLRCEAAISLANPCTSTGGSKETMI